jgi:tetratricopeptide (TPR) repeat protein
MLTRLIPLLIAVLGSCGGSQQKPAADTRPDEAAAADRESRRLFEEGKRAYESGDLETAIARWEAGNSVKRDAVFEFNLAQAELRSERLDRAAAHLRAYLQLAPQAPNRGEAEKALADVEDRAARAESQRLFDSGNDLFREGKNDEAIAAWEAGYAKHPSAAFLYNIAEAHLAAKHTKEALIYLDRYLEAAPDSPRRSEVEKQIKQLRRPPRK